MHTRSAKNKVTGKFTVTVTDWNGVECFRGEFDDMHEADMVAAREERMMTLRMQMPAPTGCGMTDAELLAELGL
jgi:hypothetical protein